jgi:hypothetical protein
MSELYSLENQLIMPFVFYLIFLELATGSLKFLAITETNQLLGVVKKVWPLALLQVQVQLCSIPALRFTNHAKS